MPNTPDNRKLAGQIMYRDSVRLRNYVIRTRIPTLATTITDLVIISIQIAMLYSFLPKSSQSNESISVELFISVILFKIIDY